MAASSCERTSNTNGRLAIPALAGLLVPSLNKMRNFNSLQKRRKMTLLKQFIKFEWMHKGAMSIPLSDKGFKSSRWLNSSTYVTVPTISELGNLLCRANSTAIISDVFIICIRSFIHSFFLSFIHTFICSIVLHLR